MGMKNSKKPAIQAYSELQQAYDFFNATLFEQMLPDMLITLQRGKNTFGYFAPDRFTGESDLSELAMNPDYFGGRSLVDTLSTLVHEMVHVWQHYTPGIKKCRGGYHDRVWGEKMEQIGLMPSNTGLPGGRKTGQQMTHYIIRGGRFQTAVYDLLKSGFSISWYDKWSEGIIAVSKINTDVLDDWLRVTDKSDRELINKLTQTVSKRNTLPDNNESVSGLESDLIIDIKPPTKGTGTRSKFTCPRCGLNAWAKPSAVLVCGECRVELE
ncbi:TPA: SprT-like domain-containing protein [Escherichia coli]|uniref:SprT-like domain-containing protein n=1 Tax=Escherichia coli TaxID=562 RepID=UPI000589F97B|nr:SprT-like domain-containing protein [Escherichia coli]EEE1944776.1 SprT family zinc-dependent metalloprotease [Salmonella enterica subsp. enterica serovar Braenderup]EHY1347107.1 sprT domain-containing protein [Escherichia coli O157]HDQ6731946.1 sprT domain-containing protein [Escherichia coli O11:H5]EER9458103.1 SprT family zinc-dependent metalloprotease [Escherichia coli]EES1508822.1 SprT family zinc-dependent metalloprotease [Escherichia coli]